MLVDTLILMALLVAIASTYSFSVSGIVKHGQKLLAYLYLFEIAERIAAVAEQRYPRAKMAAKIIVDGFVECSTLIREVAFCLLLSMS